MHVLVVEDERQLAKHLRQGLEQEGYVVAEAHDGAKALKRAKAAAYDVILLDWMLPDTDGIEVCRWLRALGDCTPIIMLTAKEFALLEYFMRNAGRVLSRSGILDSVWGYEHDPSSNIVDVYVRCLRKKIDDGFERPLLHTVGEQRSHADGGRAGGTDRVG